MRSCARHAHAANIASRGQTLDACTELDGEFDRNSARDVFMYKGIEAFNSEVVEDHRLEHDCSAQARQQVLSKCLDEAEHARFMAGLSIADQAYINSEMLPGASDWLESCPIGENCMSTEEFSNELKMRLLRNIFPEDTYCDLCGDVMDRKGRHAALCPCGGDRTRRHNGVRDRVCKFASTARLQPEKEKPGLLQPSADQPNAAGRRPADVFIPSWHRGAGAALDIAVTSPLRFGAVLEASRRPGAAASQYEQSKRNYLNTAADCLQQGFSFIPVVGEPSGGWGPAAQCVFKSKSRLIAAQTGQDAAVELKWHKGSPLVCSSAGPMPGLSSVARLALLARLLVAWPLPSRLFSWRMHALMFDRV